MAKKFNRFSFVYKSQKERALRDTYVKTKFKQFQQIRKNIRTRHK